MKIIIINGPCGVGKSTLAKRVHEAMELSLLLDVDSQRRLFSQYRETPENYQASGKAAIGLTNAMLESALSFGRDVVIDKMTYQHEILDMYYQIAEKYGAEVIEIILFASREKVLERADARGYKEGATFTRKKCEFFWEQIDKIKNERPEAAIIDTTELSEDKVYDRLREILDSSR